MATQLKQSSLKQRKGHNKYPPAVMAEAVKRIQNGESPFRVAEEMGIARTTMLYWVDRYQLNQIDSLAVTKSTDEAKVAAEKDGVGHDPAEILKRGIYITYFRACMKHLTIISRRPKSVDAERSSRIIRNLDFKVSSVMSHKSSISFPKIEIDEEDQVELKEFLVAQRIRVKGKEKSAEDNLARSSVDGAEEAEELGGDDSPKEKGGA